MNAQRARTYAAMRLLLYLYIFVILLESHRDAELDENEAIAHVWVCRKSQHQKHH